MQCVKMKFKISVLPHYASIKKNSNLMLYGEMIGIYCEICTECVNTQSTLCGQNLEFL